MNGRKAVARIEQAHHRTGDELWVIGGWCWLEQRLMYHEMMQRERQKSEEQFAQLDFLSVLGLAA